MRRIVLAAFASAALWTGSAHAYTDLFALGDSLTDGGNAFALTGNGATGKLALGWPPSPPSDQRFSNGPTAAEQLALLLGLPAIQRSTAGGTNYAVGGATTGLYNFNYLAGSPIDLPATLLATGMQSQVLATPATLPGDALMFLWGGPNDIFLASGSGGDPVAAVGQAVQNLTGIVTDLANKGARNFVVLNMPDMGIAPAFRATPESAAVTMLAQGFNAGLNDAMMYLEAVRPELEITVFNTFALLHEVTAHPASYGFTNVTSACLASLSALAGGCAGYLYFDGIHPTTATHAVVAGALNTALVPEPQTWAMLAAGLLLLAVAVRRHRLG